MAGAEAWRGMGHRISAGTCTNADVSAAARQYIVQLAFQQNGSKFSASRLRPERSAQQRVCCATQYQSAQRVLPGIWRVAQTCSRAEWCAGENYRMFQISRGNVQMLHEIVADTTKPDSIESGKWQHSSKGSEVRVCETCEMKSNSFPKRESVYCAPSHASRQAFIGVRPLSISG